jgi:hypothetical protein
VAKKVEAISAPPARLLDIKKSAAYLGTTTWQIRKLVWAKEIAHLRLGQRLLFDVLDLNRFIESQKIGVRA